VVKIKPISLCNVLYKIVSKVIVNRLKVMLLHIISPYYSAFIPRGLIANNISVAYETLHSMHNRLWGKKSYMAIKIDMRKA
jgi:hypothetical protein